MSTIVTFGVMYLNIYQFSDARWSATNFYMTLMMGATMTVIMLGFMHSMYKNMRMNVAIYLGSVVVFLVMLYLVRSHTTVQDVSYMRTMIPHHSMAILSSEHAEIEDVRVRALADDIIESQRREIKEMDWLIKDIRENGIASTQAEADTRPVPNFEVNMSYPINAILLRRNPLGLRYARG
ncbi:MAG: hypothetical protein BroJett018_21690 [Chloroflexota bacterium]|nr:MAG: hypothetical protein BroJett018_21690 [Chloroflexota bacterium]